MPPKLVQKNGIRKYRPNNHMPIVESFPDGLLEIVHEYANPPADPTSVHKINARVMLFLKEKKRG